MRIDLHKISVTLTTVLLLTAVSVIPARAAVVDHPKIPEKQIDTAKTTRDQLEKKIETVKSTPEDWGLTPGEYVEIITPLEIALATNDFLKTDEKQIEDTDDSEEVRDISDEEWQIQIVEAVSELEKAALQLETDKKLYSDAADALQLAIKEQDKAKLDQSLKSLALENHSPVDASSIDHTADIVRASWNTSGVAERSIYKIKVNNELTNYEANLQRHFRNLQALLPSDHAARRGVASAWAALQESVEQFEDTEEALTQALNPNIFLIKSNGVNDPLYDLNAKFSAQLLSSQDNPMKQPPPGESVVSDNASPQNNFANNDQSAQDRVAEALADLDDANVDLIKCKRNYVTAVNGCEGQFTKNYVEKYHGRLQDLDISFRGTKLATALLYWWNQTPLAADNSEYRFEIDSNADFDMLDRLSSRYPYELETGLNSTDLFQQRSDELRAAIGRHKAKQNRVKELLS